MVRRGAIERERLVCLLRSVSCVEQVETNTWSVHSRSNMVFAVVYLPEDKTVIVGPREPPKGRTIMPSVFGVFQFVLFYTHETLVDHLSMCNVEVTECSP